MRSKIRDPDSSQVRGSLRCGGQIRISPEDICYQAAVTQLHSRDGMSARAAEAALHEPLDAEYECDQARWERDCPRAAMMEHSHFKLAVPLVVPKAP